MAHRLTDKFDFDKTLDLEEKVLWVISLTTNLHYYLSLTNNKAK